MRIMVASAFAVALLCSLILLVLPAYSGQTGRATLLQVNGPRVLLPLAIPPSITLLPLLLRGHSVRIGATIALGLFCLISGFSIGMFYVPSALLLILANLPNPFAREP